MEEIFGWAAPLRDLPISFFHGAFPLRIFFSEREVFLLFMNNIFLSIKTDVRAETPAAKRKREDHPGRQGEQLRAFSAAGEEKRAAGTQKKKQDDALTEPNLKVPLMSGEGFKETCGSFFIWWAALSDALKKFPAGPFPSAHSFKKLRIAFQKAGEEWMSL